MGNGHWCKNSNFIGFEFQNSESSDLNLAGIIGPAKKEFEEAVFGEA